MILDHLKIQIYADGADLKTMKKYANDPLISGLTTNPTLMRKAGIENYENFAKEALSIIGDKPISFEVFSDDLDEMYYQAQKIANWGRPSGVSSKLWKNVYIKIPITNTKGVTTKAVVTQLVKDGIRPNVTAIFTYHQVEEMIDAIGRDNDGIISVFAGRIADTGLDPFPFMRSLKQHFLYSDDRGIGWKPATKIKLLWASPRHILDIFRANDAGVDIITVTDDILKKIPLIGKSLEEYSLETVKMFYNDAVASGYTL